MLEDALNILIEHTPNGHPRRVPLEKCCGRVLAEDIVSDMDFPPFDRSPLDGYAVRMRDIREASPDRPVFLRQVDDVPAGYLPKQKIGAGQAARIMTGARIPDGADAVVKLEDSFLDKKRVGIINPHQANNNICDKGEEIRSGEVVLSTGTYLLEGALGLLAMLGQAAPKVYPQPKVGILATGSELLPVRATLEPGKIRDTNSIMLDAKVRLAGGVPVLLGQVQDDIDAIITRLRAQPRMSMYITTGGASSGDYDLAEELFSRLQVPILFKRVAIKPGMLVLAGVWKGALLIALSGNPGACSISFEVLLRPLLRKLAGFRQWSHTRLSVKLSSEFTKSSPVRRFIWARCFVENGIVYAMPLQHQGNGMLRSILGANALLDIPEASPPLGPGTELDALVITPAL